MQCQLTAAESKQRNLSVTYKVNPVGVCNQHLNAAAANSTNKFIVKKTGENNPHNSQLQLTDACMLVVHPNILLVALVSNNTLKKLHRSIR